MNHPNQILRRFLLLSFFAILSCSKGEVRTCPEEPQQVEFLKNALEVRPKDLSDATAGGVLTGPNPSDTKNINRIVLLLDYSGSMYGGYEKNAPENCGICGASAITNKKTKLSPIKSITKDPKTGKRIYYYGTNDFKKLVADWLDAASPEGSSLNLEILMFNGQLWQVNDKGLAAYKDASSLTFSKSLSTSNTSQIQKWLDVIPADPTAFNYQSSQTTDPTTALETAIASLQGEGLVWLMTDNIVDVGSSDAAGNLKFYNLLEAEPKIQMVNAYGLQLPNSCTWMCGSSLFVYGLYISSLERAASDKIRKLEGMEMDGSGPKTDGLLWNDNLQKIGTQYNAAKKENESLAGVPIRLKPIDKDVLSIRFNTFGKQALDCSKRTEFGDAPTCYAKVTIKNTLRHQVIESAELSFTNQVMLPHSPEGKERLPWASAVCSNTFKINQWQIVGKQKGTGTEKITIGPIDPLQSIDVELLFQLPSIGVAYKQPAEIYDVAMTDKIQLYGSLKAELNNIKTKLLLGGDSLKGVYGTDSLPNIFKAEKTNNISIEYPASAQLQNDGQLLGFIFLGVIVLGIILVIFIGMLFQKIHLTVKVNGNGKVVSLRRFGSQSIEYNKTKIGYISRGMGQSYSMRATSNYQLGKDGGAYTFAPKKGIESQVRVEVVRGVKY